MLVDPNIADAEPLIVAGPPRCGTGFVASALNAHPDVHLVGEQVTPAAVAGLGFLREVNSHFDRLADGGGKGAKRAERWQQRRPLLLYAMWAAASKHSVERPDGPVRWFGHKTPYHERHWREYGTMLAPLRPKWVVCFRSFESHYLSCEAMNAQGIERRAKLYREAMAHYAEMRAELGSDVALFVLDDLAEGGTGYLRSAVFDSLGIPADDSALGAADPSRPVNASSRRGASKRRLTRDERRFLAGNPDLTGALDSLRAITTR